MSDGLFLLCLVIAVLWRKRHKQSGSLSPHQGRRWAVRWRAAVMVIVIFPWGGVALASQYVLPSIVVNGFEPTIIKGILGKSLATFGLTPPLGNRPPALSAMASGPLSALSFANPGSYTNIPVLLSSWGKVIGVEPSCGSCIATPPLARAKSIFIANTAASGLFDQMIIASATLPRAAPAIASDCRSERLLPAISLCSCKFSLRSISVSASREAVRSLACSADSLARAVSVSLANILSSAKRSLIAPVFQTRYVPAATATQPASNTKLPISNHRLAASGDKSNISILDVLLFFGIILVWMPALCVAIGRVLKSWKKLQASRKVLDQTQEDR